MRNVQRRGLGDSLVEPLRGCSVSTVLSRGGDLFSDHRGTLDTYSTSEPVRTIDVFISHTWRDNRFAKFAVLAQHFNIWVAVICTLVVLYGVRYFVISHATSKHALTTACFGPAIVATAFILALSYWSLLRRTWGLCSGYRYELRGRSRPGGGPTHTPSPHSPS